MSLEEKLNEEFEGWLLSVKVRREAYLSAKSTLKQKKIELTQVKSAFNWSYKQWREARQEAIKAKRRIYAKPYAIRKWTKNNMGKAIDNILNEKLIKGGK